MGMIFADFASLSHAEPFPGTNFKGGRKRKAHSHANRFELRAARLPGRVRNLEIDMGA